MKIEEAKRRVDDIRASSGDYDTAHGMEDELFLDFIKAVANNEFKTKKEMIEVAKVVECSSGIDFPRHTS